MRLAPGEVVAVLGPNGAGKSTLLSVIAGLVRPDAGHVRAGERMLLDTDAGTDVPVARRRVGLLAQDALLFGSLSVAENVEFGPRSQGVGRQESSETARRWLAEVGAGDLAERKPRKLSGGQAQRVAIARALAAGPEVLLLDEPMGSLDVAVAAQVRSMLRRVLRDRAAATDGRSAAVIVTHDLVDALTLADRIIVLDNGSVVDDGPVERVLRSPRSPFAADLAGTNMVSGRAVAAVDVAMEPDGAGSGGRGGRRWRRERAAKAPAAGGAAVGMAAGGFAVEGDAPSSSAAIRTVSGAQVSGGTLHRLVEDEPAVAVFSPRAVAVYRTAPHGSPRNVFRVRATAVEARGDAIRVRAADDAGTSLMAEMTTTAARELGIAAGDEAVFVVKASEVRVYPG
ncbi:sulfate/molybdate ABC transporter ATP-binding protein [Tomitella fengzijianii]|uniref:ATP-binding cassette domain-containing protein n=1 Tax=Tomitella fengzijianii TaxID=2597660 RepID=A0A516X7P5_9ACTN|nr:ATP-binding cassette domain-containing protein [Tomitella fengzijianii]QDQ99088.1 ATP-binding cassette domain-containing protein [Tomitella fengzijianii]